MIPANGRKNEYHKRVSPIVRIGGRSKEIHMPTMKLKKTAKPRQVKVYTTTGRLPRQCQTKSSQSPRKSQSEQWQTEQNNPNSYRLLLSFFCSFRCIDKQADCPQHHHYDAGIYSRKPGIAYQFKNTDITPPSFRFVIA